ncbi:hypothetical protein QU481_09220 [Crenobacter sp. SG2303]|uniref:Uncharacterized protein n=1 Tax=Crenobacter oryzisoli TaxID=3056844 RepID=A0ABT7XMQ3_9NEIS|nr:hypothetical protein [Crenobacter sp. SG2303]MDN0075073.1 hypothetical protein [Crenobacter sp. SG2303]
MALIQVGLVDKNSGIDPSLLQEAAAALNIQVMRDVPKFWNVQATVRYLPHARHIPIGVWPVFLVDNLPPDEGGFHLNKRNQPFAEVEASPASDGWTVAASHEIIEMLVDPSGNRLQSSRSIEINGTEIQDGTGQFEYLVEACDPCEADNFAYSIQGIAVSDFITQNFYDPVTTSGARYSFTGAITAPRQILPGGYISWVDPVTNKWQQLRYLDPAAPPVIVDLGPATSHNLREWVHTKNAKEERLQTPQRIARSPANQLLFQRCKDQRMALRMAAEEHGNLYNHKLR